MKTLKILSSFTNKIGILTNRKNNKENKNEFIPLKTTQDIDNIIQNIKNFFEKNKALNNTERNFEKLEIYFSSIKKLLDFNNFDSYLFQYLIQSDLILILTENINIYSNKVSNSIIIFLQKIIFLDEIFITEKNLKEESILINPKIVNSLKKIIFEFDSILKKVNIIDINSDLYFLIDTGILPFLNELFQKILKYSNLFYSLLNNSTTININLELQLFDILFILFKFEPQIKERTSRTYIRKNILRFINNFNFQNRKELLKKLINQLILNLIEYYQNFLLLSIKEINDNYKIINNFPLDLSENDIMELISDDTLSYLEYFNIIINNFLEKDLKEYLIDLLYNNFLCKYILEEIINLSNDISYKARSTLLIEYIYFMSKSIKNYDINVLLFYFFFGYNLDIESDNDINNINISYKKIISKSNNNYESIRAFFTLIFDSNNTNLLILLIKTLTNLAKRIPYIFISEMISPYYLFYLNKKKESNEDFEETLEKITKKPEHISLLEVIKITMPQNFGIAPKNWINYYLKNLEINFRKNMNNLNLMNNSFIQDFINDSSLMNKSDGNNGDISYNYKNMVNISSYSFSDYNNNDSILSLRNNNLNESIFGNQTIKEENEIINISIENKYNYILTSTIFASRVKFFEMFLKKFKKYIDNKYEENLYLSEFFIEIFSFLSPLNSSNELYYIYSWGAFSKKNNDKLFDVSASGILSYIKNQIDKKVMNEFNKKEINNFDYFLNDNNYEIFEMNVDLNTEIGKRIEFLKNIKLYNEIFKDFSSNIFSKILNDESNHYWIKGIKQNTKNNEYQ